MYVCICNGLNDRRIEAALEDGARSAAAVYAGCGVRPQCGKCVDTVRHMVRRHQAAAKAETAALPALAFAAG